MLHNSQKDFIKRHIGTSKEEQSKMLNELGYESLDDLIKDTVPEKIHFKDELSIGEPNSEYEALRKLKIVSKKNQIYSNFIGMGYYGTYTPNVIVRNILENPGWYTSYTPYQPEVAQGRLEMLLNFQQMIIDFTGMDIANASLLDEGTAVAEAMGLSHRINKSDSNLIFISENCHPQTIDVVKTRAEPMGLKMIVGNDNEELDKLKEDLVCGIIQYPGTLGDIKDPSESISKIHKKKGKAILACDLLALAKLKTPRELGADIAVGSSQRFGIPMGYGGPHAAFFATKDEFKRSMPGRIIGVSVDRHGNKAYRLSLQTREQHIRRDKATSNICTAQALLAIVSAAYAIYHGPEGIRAISERVSQLAKKFSDKLKQSGNREDWRMGKKLEAKLRTFAPVVVRGEEQGGTKFWGFGKTVYQELLSIIADPDYGDITDPVNGRDVGVEFKTAEEIGASFPKTTIRVKPNQTQITEDAKELETLLNSQKDIREIYNEQTYDELAEVLQKWLNPSEDDEETDTKKETEKSSTVSTLQSNTTTSDASAAFDDLFNS